MATRPRATRLATPSVGTDGYVDAYRVALPAGESRSPEAWARAVFEDANPLLRRLLRLGWRHVLGLRPAPGPPRSHVLGWAAVEQRDGAIVLGRDGPGLASPLTATVDRSGLTQTTRVQFVGGLTRARRSVVGPAHRRVAPCPLTRAARRNAAVATR